MNYRLGQLLLLSFLLFLPFAGHGQTAPVLWTNKWDVNFFMPQTTGFSSDSRYYAVGYENGDVVIFESATGEVFRNYHLHASRVFSTTFQPGGRLLVSGDKKGIMVIYDYVEGKEMKTVEAHDNALRSITFSKDGNLLITGSNDNTIKKWDPYTGKLLGVINDIKGNVKVVRITNDNKTIVVGTSALSKGLRLFDANSGIEVRTFESANLQNMDMSPDGRYVATANLQKYVMVFDLKQYREVANLKGHTKHLSSVAFGANGTILYSAAEDKNVIAWDMQRYTELTSIFQSQRNVSSMACSPDGRYLAVMDENGVMSMLDVSFMKGVIRSDEAKQVPKIKN